MPEIATWQDLVGKGKALTIPGEFGSDRPVGSSTFINAAIRSPRPKVARAPRLRWNWAEGLYEAPHPSKIANQTGKGNRNEIVGKVFSGLEDGWIIGSSAKASTPSLWWRCGRLHPRAREDSRCAADDHRPQHPDHAAIRSTSSASWKSSDESWDKLIPLFDRAYKIAAHETWTDTPYYEQMCYVGDNLLNAVANYALVQGRAASAGVRSSFMSGRGTRRASSRSVIRRAGGRSVRRSRSTGRSWCAITRGGATMLRSSSRCCLDCAALSPNSTRWCGEDGLLHQAARLALHRLGHRRGIEGLSAWRARGDSSIHQSAMGDGACSRRPRWRKRSASRSTPNAIAVSPARRSTRLSPATGMRSAASLSTCTARISPANTRRCSRC